MIGTTRENVSLKLNTFLLYTHILPILINIQINILFYYVQVL